MELLQCGIFGRAAVVLHMFLKMRNDMREAPHCCTTQGGGPESSESRTAQGRTFGRGTTVDIGGCTGGVTAAEAGLTEQFRLAAAALAREVVATAAALTPVSRPHVVVWVVCPFP